MSVTSTMFTGVSGLLANAEGMSVIGNNISNVNTIGFKGSRTLFSDTLSTSIAGGSQVGHGVQLQKVDNLFTQGSFESTGNVTDLALQGNSFFAVKDPNVTSPVNQNNAMLTRSGAFRLDSNLNLVNPDGYQVLDTQGNPIKFSDNAAAIATITAALTTQCTAPASVLNTQAAALINPATVFADSIFTAAANVYNTQAPTIVASATTFEPQYAALAPTYTTQATNLNTAALLLPAGTTPGEIAAITAIKAAAVAAVTAAANADPASAVPGVATAANIAAAKKAFDLVTSLTNSSSATMVTPAVVTAYNTFTTALGTTNTTNATAVATTLTGGTTAEVAAQAAIKAAATAAATAATAATSSPSATNVAAAQAKFEALNTLVNNSTFTTSELVTAFNTFKASLTAVNSANATNAPPAEVNKAIAIKAATTAAQTAAITANTTPTPVTVAAAQAAFDSLAKLTNSSNFTPAPFITAYNTFKLSLDPAKAAVDAAMATAAPMIASAQDQLNAAQGLAFSKITSIDPSGLITYLGKDGITLNYYNASGQVGVSANTANSVGAQRLAVVNVTNQGGLEKAGGTLYRSTTDSGVPTSGFSLSSNTANGSSDKIYTNALEQSNVDMANEFVKMILTQRAYSAGSKIITTADEMTQEVINLKR